MPGGSNNLDLALRIKADLDQARTEVRGMRSDLDGLAKTGKDVTTAIGGTNSRLDALLKVSTEAAQSLKQLQQSANGARTANTELAAASDAAAVSSKAAAAAAKTQGESDAEAATRIRTMVAASLQKKAALDAEIVASRGSKVSTDASAAASAAAAANARAYTASVQTQTLVAVQAAKAQRDQAAALQLFAAIDPAAGKLQQLDQLEARLRKLSAAGVVGAEDFAAMSAKLAATRAALTGVGEAEQAVILNSRAMGEVSTLVSEVMSGNFGRIRRSAAALANQSGVLQKLFTPAGLGVVLLSGSVLALVAGLVKGYLELQDFDSALIATGNYAGKTGSQLDAIASQVGAASGSYGKANDAVKLLAESGKIAGDSLDVATRGAVAFSEVANKDIGEAVKAFVSLQEDPVRAVRALDEQYHFLETSTYAEILALDKQGDRLGAAALAQKSLADAMEDRQSRDVQNLGIIQKAWRSLDDEIERGWNLLKQWGSQSIQQQIDQLYVARGAAESLKTSLMTRNVPGIDALADGRIASIDKQIDALQDQAAAQEKADQAESKHRQQQEAGNAALTAIAASEERYATAAAKYKDQLKAINKEFDDAIKATPDKAGELNARRNALLQEVTDQYNKSAIAKAAAEAKRTAAEQARVDKAGAGAQQDLINTLAQLQAQLDPTAAAWKTYNDTVEKATKDAETAKLARGADVTAIDAERNGVIATAATIRDAAIDKLADKDRQAWEQLRDSLATPAEANVDKAIAKITELNKLMEKGAVPDAAAYQKALSGIVDQSLPKQTGASRGVNSLLPGAVDTSNGPIGATFQAEKSEAQRFAEEQAALAAERAAALAAAQKYGQDELKVQQTFAAKEEAAQQSHAAAMKQITQARFFAELDETSAAFGQLAELAKDRYGAESKQYRILFALSKAFAIAKAAVSLAENVATASSVGFPQNIPYIVGAFAQGAEIASLLSQAVYGGGSGAGYEKGGYTGPGARNKVAGYVHAGEGVLSQDDIAALGGPAGFAALQRGLRGYADGGFVHPLSGVPAPAMSSMPRARINAPAANDANAGARQQSVKVVVVLDKDQMAHEIMNTPTGQKVIVQTAGDNPRAIQSKWGT